MAVIQLKCFNRCTHDPLRRLLSSTGREISKVYQRLRLAVGFCASENLTAINPALFGGTRWDLNIRLMDYTATNTYTRSYQYDKLGNIQYLSHKAAGHANPDFERDYTYDGSDNKLRAFTVNSNLFQNKYDPSGNLAQEGQSRIYEWTANDKMAVFKNQAGNSTPSVYTNYFYNARGERIKKHTQKGNKLIVTFYTCPEVTRRVDGGMFETSYVKTVGGGIDSKRFYNTIKISDEGALIATIRVGENIDDHTPAIKYIVGDHLNNSTAVLKITGTLINREEFYPFGETSFGGFQYKRYRYNGKEKDEESGLYEYGQRYYAPWICRFVSVDPVAEKFADLSSYNYAGNRPITKVDLEGLQEQGRNEQPQQNPQKGTGKSVTYRTPAGDTFRDPNIHNTATAKGKSEVITTVGVLVPTRTNALLQFDYKGETYKAHFSRKTLDFTAYKTEEGKEYSIPYSEGPYTANIDLTVSENKPDMLTFNAEITGNEDWVWNNTRFSFDIPVKFEYGLTLDQDIPSIPSSVSGESAFKGQIILGQVKFTGI